MMQLFQRYPLTAYFVSAFVISWGGALAVLLPKLATHQEIPTWYGLLTFPAMLLGPALVGIGLTMLLGGQRAMHDLLWRVRNVRVPIRWYAQALVVPITMLTVLFGMSAIVSSVFAPNFFPLGFLFGPDRRLLRRDWL